MSVLIEILGALNQILNGWFHMLVLSVSGAELKKNDHLTKRFTDTHTLCLFKVMFYFLPWKITIKPSFGEYFFPNHLKQI